MAKSEITHCLGIIDFYGDPDIFTLKAGEKLLMDYCVRQGSKNNLGIFKEYRGAIAMKLGLDHDLVYHFFLNNPNLIEMDPDTHFIWVKPLYKWVDFGLRSPLYKTFKDKKTNKSSEVLNLSGLKIKNKFISKIKTGFREDHILQKIFEQKWVNYNCLFLARINEEVKTWKGNKYNLDTLLLSYSAKALKSYQQGV